MATPEGVDLRVLFTELDKRSELAGARVVYFDGGTMSVLRQGPPICQSGLLAIVMRKGGRDLLPTSSEIAQARDARFNAELLNLGLSCGGVLLAWAVSATSTGAAPITGGLSLIITGISTAAGVASYAQCLMAGALMYNEFVDPNANVEMDDERWYIWFSAITDGVSLAGTAITGAQTLKMIRILKNSTHKSALEVLKGLSRQEGARVRPRDCVRCSPRRRRACARSATPCRLARASAAARVFGGGLARTDDARVWLHRPVGCCPR